ncbi:MAG: hypothetical protein LBB20_02725 [Puniceicoccales bacterium]|jgi:hypothetical protein|nr:hypothetical protein [Puniceicoccales bacterium]
MRVVLCFILLLISSLALVRSDDEQSVVDVFDLKPSIPPVEIGNLWPLVFAGVVILLLLVLVLYLIFRRFNGKKLPTVQLSSFEEVLRDLKHSRSFIGPETTDEFAVLVSNAIRRYLQREYNIRVISKTSEEFLKIFDKSVKLDWLTSSLLADILKYSDFAKFAAKTYSDLQQREIYVKACNFVRAIECKKNRQRSANSVSKAKGGKN